MPYLVLIRHGESVWNAKGIWTGLSDIDLDEKGKEVARQNGQVIKDIHFDRAFTSRLKRARHSLDEIQRITGDVPTVEDDALNERDYGKFTGKNKWEIEKEAGEEQFLKWRRGWDEPIPGGETLRDVYNRVVPYYQNNILPILKKDQNVLVVAHGNSLRALVKFLDNISDEDIQNLEVATGEVDIYQLGSSGKVISKKIIGPKLN